MLTAETGGIEYRSRRSLPDRLVVRAGLAVLLVVRQRFSW